MYKNEAVSTAMICLREAIEKFQNGVKPTPLNYNDPNVKGTLKPNMKQKDRFVDWNATAEEVAIGISASDGQPGVLDNFCDTDVFLFGAHVDSGATRQAARLLCARVAQRALTAPVRAQRPTRTASTGPRTSSPSATARCASPRATRARCGSRT
jgi:methionyl-tRNA formyltransferase